VIFACGTNVDNNISNQSCCRRNTRTDALPCQTRTRFTRPLDNILDVLLGDSLRLARGAKSTWGPESALGSRSPVHGTAKALNWGNESAGRHGNLQVFRRGGDDLFWQVGDMDSASFILVALGNYLK
jgi:hypothetical protein